MPEDLIKKNKSQITSLIEGSESSLSIIFKKLSSQNNEEIHKKISQEIEEYRKLLEVIKNPLSSKKYFLDKDVKSQFSSLITHSIATQKLIKQNYKIIEKNHEKLQKLLLAIILNDKKLSEEYQKGVNQKYQQTIDSKTELIKQASLASEVKIYEYLAKKNSFSTIEKRNNIIAAKNIIKDIPKIDEKNISEYAEKINELKNIEKSLISERKARRIKSKLRFLGRFKNASRAEKTIQAVIKNFESITDNKNTIKHNVQS